MPTAGAAPKPVETRTPRFERASCRLAASRNRTASLAFGTHRSRMSPQKHDWKVGEAFDDGYDQLLTIRSTASSAGFFVARKNDVLTDRAEVGQRAVLEYIDRNRGRR